MNFKRWRVNRHKLTIPLFSQRPRDARFSKSEQVSEPQGKQAHGSFGPGGGETASIGTNATPNQFYLPPSKKYCHSWL